MAAPRPRKGSRRCKLFRDVGLVLDKSDLAQLGQEGGGGDSGEGPYFADEMRLIVVARLGREPGPCHWTGSKRGQGAPEADHPGERLGRDAHGFTKSPLQVASTDADGPLEL